MPIDSLFQDFGELVSMSYDTHSLDWSKSPFYKEEDEIRLFITSYWIELGFTNLRQKFIVPNVETKFSNGKIRDYVSLPIFNRENFLTIVPEIILGPNFDNSNQSSLENFLQIQFACGVEFDYLKPDWQERPVIPKKNPKILTVYVSRGNPISLDRYRKETS